MFLKKKKNLKLNSRGYISDLVFGFSEIVLEDMHQKLTDAEINIRHLSRINVPNDTKKKEDHANALKQNIEKKKNLLGLIKVALEIRNEAKNI